MLALANAYLQIRRHSLWPYDALLGLQERRLRGLIRFISSRSPYHAGRLAGFDGSVESLPQMEKREFMDDLGRLNTRGFDAQAILRHCLLAEDTRDFSRRFRGCTAALSSGTSGNRGVELLSRAEEQVLTALYLARFPFPAGPLRVAFILRVSSPALSRSLFGNRLIYIDPLQPTESLVARINTEAPTVLAAQPSVLRVLAREFRAGRLRVAPRTVVGYAEVFTAPEKAHLAETFGCEVAEIYKCTEGPVAQTCRHGRLHINEDLVIVELDDHGREGPREAAPPRLVVTNLIRRVLPVIRFKLNDCVDIDSRPCPCGSGHRVIAAVHGRANDLLWFPRLDSGGAQLVLPDFFERAIISSSDEIEEYEVVQDGPESVVITLQTTAGADRDRIMASISERLHRVFQAAGCRIPQLDVEFAPVRRRADTGKLVRVRKEWGDENRSD